MNPNNTIVASIIFASVTCVSIANAQQHPDPKNFIIKFSPLHLFERTYKVGFEYKTRSLRHSLSIYASGISLRERHTDYRILSGISGELQYRYYTVNEVREEKPINICNFFTAFVRAAQHHETYQTNPPQERILKETTYTTKDFGVGYGIQLNWKQFTAEIYGGPAVRLNDIDIKGSRTYEGKPYEELDQLRRPPLDHHGLFGKGGFELGYKF
jgi:hypothetical protein